MIYFEKWFIYIWSFVFLLYFCGWSALNPPIDYTLLGVFLVAFLFAFIMLKTFRKTKERYIPLIVHNRRPTVTIFILLGFICDFLYQGYIPLMHPYSGYDTDAVFQERMGIPYFHVLIIALAVYYGMYLSYLCICNKEKTYAIELLSILIFLFLNNSRGYIVFIVIVSLLLFVGMNANSIAKLKVKVVVFCLIIFFLLLCFISIMGNIRSGYLWNDFSYINNIGKFSGENNWFFDFLTWPYLYITTPLGNLNLNMISKDYSYDFVSFISAFLPENISKMFAVSPTRHLYVASYLNASTGYIVPLKTFGAFGLFFAIIFQLLFYELIRFYIAKNKCFLAFTDSCLSFLIIVSLFYNSFSTSAVCFIPFFLLITNFYLKKKLH